MIELMVVIVVIGILAALLLPAIARTKERTKRIACVSNLKQLGIASQLHAEEDEHGSLSSKIETDDQNLNWLFPFCGDLRLFRCPSTRNFVRTNQQRSSLTGMIGYTDLFNHSPDRGEHFGMSYVGMGFTGVNVDTWEEIHTPIGPRVVNGIRKNLANINTYRKYHNTFGLKGVIPGPSNLWLIMDNTLSGTAFYPDGHDNHGREGCNVVFCDGHVEWISPKRFVFAYEFSQDENRTDVR